MIMVVVVVMVMLMMMTMMIKVMVMVMVERRNPTVVVQRQRYTLLSQCFPHYCHSGDNCH